MPIYFTDVAPTCPVSHDQPLPPDAAHNFGRPQFVRPAVPHAFDLSSAIKSANILRQIVSQITNIQVRNNVKPGRQGKVTIVPDKYKLKTARWTEQKKKRVRQNYKYYGKDDKGEDDKSTWVVMERIERMVWYDKAWKSYMVWEYGDKGEGEPVGKQKTG